MCPGNEVVAQISADILFVSSHERKFLGFKLLETLLPALTASEVSGLLLLLLLLLLTCVHTTGFHGV